MGKISIILFFLFTSVSFAHAQDSSEHQMRLSADSVRQDSSSHLNDSLIALIADARQYLHSQQEKHGISVFEWSDLLKKPIEFLQLFIGAIVALLAWYKKRTEKRTGKYKDDFSLWNIIIAIGLLYTLGAFLASIAQTFVLLLLGFLFFGVALAQLALNFYKIQSKSVSKPERIEINQVFVGAVSEKTKTQLEDNFKSLKKELSQLNNSGIGAKIFMISGEKGNHSWTRFIVRSTDDDTRHVLREIIETWKA